MNRFRAMGTGARAAILAGGTVIAGAAGYGLWFVNQQATPNVPLSGDLEVTDTAPAATKPADASAPSDPSGAANPQSAEAPDTAGVPPAESPVEGAAADSQTILPSFDLVRVEPDGQALVAGRAAPGAEVILRLDGTAVTATTADANGDFAALFVLDPSAAPRILTMGSSLPGQQEIPAEAEVALAPTSAIVAVAEPETPLVAAADPAQVAPDVETAVAPDVPADPPAALLVTKEGVNVLQSPDQTAFVAGDDGLVLDTISYTPSGDVQLAGRAMAGSVLRIYLDNAPLIDVTVGEDGRWASTMPIIAPGIYTLRVDALAPDGAVTVQFETPFKRETPEALSAATQVPVAAADVVATVGDEIAATATDVPALAVPAAPDAAQTAEPEVPGEADDPVQTVEIAKPAPPPAPVSITVQPGFTLWGIASEQFGDGVLYVQVFEANKDKIRDPNLIYPGQVFVIPAESE